MKINKTLEKEIQTVMDDYWNSYFEGNLQRWASFLPDHYRNIGTTKEEIWNSKKEIWDYTVRVTDQMVGMADMRNKKIQIIPYDPYIMVHELGDLYVKADEGWVFYALLRLSSLLEKTSDGWKILHQHGSYPDSKAAEGETFGFNELKAENKKLRDAIQSRTIELERKNRELEIEASMERVRAKAMAMHKPDELVEVAMLLRKEMGSLGVEELETSSIYIHSEATGKTECWFSIQDREQEEKLVSDHMMIDLNDTWVGREMLQFYRSDNERTSIVMQGANRSEWINYCAENSELFTVEGFYGEKIPERTYHLYKFNSGFMGAAAPGDISAESWDLLKRATSVFSLAYTRFVDLKNAEAQAREAKIETALERVRARTMGMQQSTELKEVIQVLFDQFGYLDIFVQHTGFILDYKDRDDMLIWLADENSIIPQVTIPYFDSPHWNSFLKAKENGSNLFVNHLDFNQKNDFYRKLFSHLTEVPEEVQEFYFKCPALAISTVLLDNVGLYIENFSGTPYTDEENEILLRFGKVFQQSYTRFLDLQKAEAQAREARVEAALEKVRSRSLAMHKSEELADLSLELVKQVQALGVETWFCAFNIYDDHPDGSLEWGSNGQGTFPRYRTPREGIFKYFYETGQQGETLLVHEIDESECPAHYEYLCSLPGVGDQLLKMKAAGISFPTYQIDHVAYFKYGYIIYITFEAVPEAHDIFKRFAKVFEQSYTRFLDLQKAEAQAREAKIEGALERVRARSMAMHKSEEMLEVADVLFQQLRGLGGALTDNLWGCGVMICKSDSEDDEVWFANQYGVLPPITMPHSEDPVHKNMYEGWKNGLELYSEFKGGKALEAHYKYMLSIPAIKPIFEKILASGLSFPTWQKWHAAYFSHGYLLIITTKHFEEEQVFTRFAKVFEQAYIRFLDLKKAEEQARAAQIEAALERVRSRAIAMRKSEELSEAAELLYNEFLKLGVESFSCGYLINDDKNGQWNVWLTNPGEPSFKEHWSAPYDADHHLSARYESWKRKEAFHRTVLEGEENRAHHVVISQFAPWKKEMLDELPPRLVINSAHFSLGHLLVISPDRLSSELEQAMVRFAGVFDLAYRRFLDLQKSEAQARETQIELALEKVRARTMAMHHPDELQEVVALVAEKLQDLGVILDANGVILCTYFENSRDVMHWISAPDFSGSGRYLLPYFDHPIFSAAWNSKLSGDDYFSQSFTVEEKNSFFEYAFEHSDYRHFPGDFKEWVFQNDKHSLSFAWSENSAILIPSHTGVVPSESDQEILKRFAAVFEQAYVRFRDLQVKEEQAARIEEEKKRLEKTLAHLQATQAQLIQSEKMASLGELTAGIAHEIQNPLNFVNNFSEVSSELIEEMKEEMDNGDLEEVKAIAEDIQQNLEKINHHGRRADAIVKGMLEHSRKSSGEKVPTDINKLADEYMRLAYHGLRAKDKSFNATLHTDFDPAIGKIPVIPQDIGRVLLNLFTNAFYAVNEKKNLVDGDYEPTVSISTRRLEDHIIIAVQDNGDGIPQSVLDKIFQPFFTTKPTGQGTGLGLSLSYDIVKAHEGRTEVETQKGTHTIFKIILPQLNQ